VKRILVVDDDARLCEVLGEFLQEEGFQVLMAYDGRQALAVLRANPVDLLILDINMPELGGATLVHMLRTDPEWAEFARLPIIVLSALWDVVTFELDIQAGFAKPVKFEEIRPKILELLGQS